MRLYTVICPTCRRSREVGREAYVEFGTDNPCDRCLERQPVTFMREHGRRLGLTCSILGCPCGAGPLTFSD